MSPEAAPLVSVLLVAVPPEPVPPVAGAEPSLAGWLGAEELVGVETAEEELEGDGAELDGDGASEAEPVGDETREGAGEGRTGGGLVPGAETRAETRRGLVGLAARATGAAVSLTG